MRAQIAKLAAENNRSMNAELIDRLEKSMAADTSLALPQIVSDPSAMKILFDRIENRLEQLQQNLERQGIVRKEK
jgi:hypothetical protein